MVVFTWNAVLLATQFHSERHQHKTQYVGDHYIANEAPPNYKGF